MTLATPKATAERASAGSYWRELAFISLASYSAITATLIVISWWVNQGTFVYSLDDPYIHLAIAKTWLRAHTLGVSPGQFAPASSSPLWTALLLCVSAVAGIHELAPLVLNILSASATVVLFWWGWATLDGRQLDDGGSSSRRRWRIAALVLPALMNLPALTLSGLEHGLHIALTLGFTIAVFKRVDPRVRDEHRPWAAFVLAALLPLARNEGIFTVAAAAWILARRDRVSASVLLACGAFPITVLGVFYVRHGAFFFPNPVVAKAVFPSASAWLVKWGANLLFLVFEPLFLAVVLVSISYSRLKSDRASEPFQFLLAIFCAHFGLAAFGGMGWLDRYESYLIDLGLFLFAVYYSPLPAPAVGHRWSTAGMKVLLGLGAFEKFGLLSTAIVGSNDIYLQQYQMGRFVEEYFANADVVANDIGLVALRAGGTVTDLAGLGSTDVLRAIRAAPQSPLIPTQFLSRAMVERTLDRNGADFVVIYPEWFGPLLYGDWRRVASWSFGRRPVTAAHETVVFFAVDDAKARILYDRLRAFEPQLPRGVRVEYSQSATR